MPNVIYTICLIVITNYTPLKNQKIQISILKYQIYYIIYRIRIVDKSFNSYQKWVKNYKINFDACVQLVHRILLLYYGLPLKILSM